LTARERTGKKTRKNSSKGGKAHPLLYGKKTGPTPARKGGKKFWKKKGSLTACTKRDIKSALSKKGISLGKVKKEEKRKALPKAERQKFMHLSRGKD